MLIIWLIFNNSAGSLSKSRGSEGSKSPRQGKLMQMKPSLYVARGKGNLTIREDGHQAC
jgi:hypothetical protein